MKKILYLCLVAILAFSCSNKEKVNIRISNDSSFDRENENVEISVKEVRDKLQLSDKESFILVDNNGKQCIYQVTYDGKLIFPVSVKAGESLSYNITKGIPEHFKSKVYGRQFSEREDDIAWENDKIAFRTYGPALQATGEKAYGYDIWVKSVPDLVIEDRYANELNPEIKAKIKILKKKNPAAADSLYRSVSYHVDHGNGLDCYKVGPTLGAGTAALMSDNTIIYPYCYKTYEILDKGPLRFTVKLVYEPIIAFGESGIVETRIISLDAGSQLNKTIINYTGLTKEIPLAAGIVLHEAKGIADYTINIKDGYISYVDPTDNPKNNNGKIYVGVVIPGGISRVETLFFDKKEAIQRGADGHLLAINNYVPGSNYTYYWGAGWSKYGYNSKLDWDAYLARFSEFCNHPLKIEIK
ncbi:DUF4861 domain-containing protein [Coprobacter tertius]|uniref:DUF4861 domain-containing protein n=1 Tax=Coprobacter tertius TaxID=2944915 RepID=A0ABT1MLH9_9BACT|nr:DUF4861 domain-containing protein [Coprobacter tertius]MCP9612126.1 DUF4861 domain-containing protein [Coprobacter tertius]